MKIQLRNNESNISHENNTVVGYALRFNESSNPLTDKNGKVIIETIMPGSLDGVIERSDVFATLNHDKSRGILARSKYGVGSLKLTVDEAGLKYEFELPDTPLGAELRSYFERNEIDSSSFAFTVKPGGYTDTIGADGRTFRAINHIERLFDISPVFSPAYNTATATMLRSLEESIEEINEVEVKEKIVSPHGEKDNSLIEERKQQEVKQEEIPHKKVDMSNFSILKTIDAAVNGRQFSEESLEVLNRGQADMKAAGLSYAGSIQLPFEYRAEGDPTNIVAGIEGFGKAAIQTDTFDLITPLMNKMVLAQAGATIINAVGNIKMPSYSGSSVTWESENATAQNGMGTFNSVSYSPLRLTAVLPISKTFLTQSGAAAEKVLRDDLINALSQKLEATLLGSAEEVAGTSPKGMFNGVVADTVDVKWADVVGMEESAEGMNMSNPKFIMSPAAKTKLRTTKKGAADMMIMESNNECIGYPVLTTNNVKSKGILFGDWSDMIITLFGALDCTIDPYSKAAENLVNIIVTMNVDAKPRRGLFVKKVLK